jgi:hypothetical protein
MLTDREIQTMSNTEFAVYVVDKMIAANALQTRRNSTLDFYLVGLTAIKEALTGSPLPRRDTGVKATIIPFPRLDHSRTAGEG